MDFQSFFDTEIEEFEDDGKYSEPNVIEEEYDAINDETFGVELHDTEGDLEEFANRVCRIFKYFLLKFLAVHFAIFALFFG